MADEQVFDRTLHFLSVDVGTSEVFNRVDQQHNLNFMPKMLLESIDARFEIAMNIVHQGAQMAGHLLLQAPFEGRIALQVSLDIGSHDFGTERDWNPETG